MLGIIGTILSGGATGLIGTAISTITGFFKQREENKMEILRIQENRKTAIVKANIELKGIEAKGRSDLAIEDSRQDGEVRKKSYDQDRATYATGAKARNSLLFVLVDTLRGIIRPALTLYLIALTTLIYIKAQAIIEAAGISSIPVDQAVDMVREVTATILYLTTTVVTWWFGNRSVEKHDLRIRINKES